MSWGIGSRYGLDLVLAVAMTYSGSCSSDLTPSLVASYAEGVALKRKKGKGKKKKKKLKSIFRNKIPYPKEINLC